MRREWCGKAQREVEGHGRYVSRYASREDRCRAAAERVDHWMILALPLNSELSHCCGGPRLLCGLAQKRG